MSSNSRENLKSLHSAHDLDLFEWVGEHPASEQAQQQPKTMEKHGLKPIT
jgi:succinate dehydrogenase flavin-adding protein (antitoxin of CptAB toxin-antitoxin module)